MSVVSKTQSDSAYPIVDQSSSLYEGYGLSKRELFAAMALQGLCTHFNKVSESEAEIAKRSVKFADILISELSNESNN